MYSVGGEVCGEVRGEVGDEVRVGEVGKKVRDELSCEVSDEEND